MMLKAWLEYPEMAISVYESKGVFRCRRYHGNTSKAKAYTDCHSFLELKYYLLSISNAPKKEIMKMITAMEKQKINAVYLTTRKETK